MEQDCGWQCLVPAIMYFKVYCLAHEQPFQREAASKEQKPRRRWYGYDITSSMHAVEGFLVLSKTH